MERSEVWLWGWRVRLSPSLLCTAAQSFWPRTWQKLRWNYFSLPKVWILLCGWYFLEANSNRNRSQKRARSGRERKGINTKLPRCFRFNWNSALPYPQVFHPAPAALRVSANRVPLTHTDSPGVKGVSSNPLLFPTAHPGRSTGPPCLWNEEWWMWGHKRMPAGLLHLALSALGSLTELLVTSGSFSQDQGKLRNTERNCLGFLFFHSCTLSCGRSYGYHNRDQIRPFLSWFIMLFQLFCKKSNCRK